MSSKSWKFTDFNMSKRPMYENLDANVVAFGEEPCPTTGRDHLQGHVTFKRTYRLAALKKLSESAHWEVALCSDFNYELKGNNIFIKDNRKKKGARTDLEELSNLVKSGASLREVADAFPSQYMRYHKGIEALSKLYKKTSEKSEFFLEDCCEWIRLPYCDWVEDPISHVILGDAGCGKTQFALAHFENALMVSHMDDLLNFNEDNDGIVFDDMDFKHMPRTAQIHILDWDNTRSIHCRYRTATIPKHTKKIFTCNEYPFVFDAAIKRRRKLMVCNRDQGD